MAEGQRGVRKQLDPIIGPRNSKFEARFHKGQRLRSWDCPCVCKDPRKEVTAGVKRTESVDGVEAGERNGAWR